MKSFVVAVVVVNLRSGIKYIVLYVKRFAVADVVVDLRRAIKLSCLMPKDVRCC